MINIISGLLIRVEAFQAAGTTREGPEDRGETARGQAEQGDGEDCC